MKVKLLNHTPLDVAYISAKTCYSPDSPITLSDENVSKEQMITFLKKVISTGHLSTVEGINFSFAIEDVSRSLLAQITHHRVGIQFSVQSQRYVKYDEIRYYTPPTIAKNKEALEVYELIMADIENAYLKLNELGIPAEDSRYVLSNATYTNISTTINLRTLVHIMGLRLCARASLEIRMLMSEMRKAILEVEPWLSEILLPQCEHLGYCPERNCCGRKDKK